MSGYVNSARQLSKKAAPVFRKYGIRKAILFGSFATGAQTRKSDVDLVLIQDTDKRYFDRFEGILQELYEAIRGRDLEVFIYTPDELEKISHRKFIRRILREGKVIYES
ncbi:MAG TPA: nucleotidyltransferase domain-containing protein [Syntrophales bacterium]|nr:nucleotidyltransferase domain-containing protein [Syntrophales bacterium]HQM30675.1 nucleotidyltransferase domain-containing protein [Syntrophales bacterium]